MTGGGLVGVSRRSLALLQLSVYFWRYAVCVAELQKPAFLVMRVFVSLTLQKQVYVLCWLQVAK